MCNFNGNYPFGSKKNGRYRERTIPVDCKTNDGQAIDAIGPNPWGLYQMHGNAWEWCEDWFAARFYESAGGREADPVNDENATARVLRGGSWITLGGDCRSAYRLWTVPSHRSGSVGFRLAAVPVEPSK